MRFGLALSGGGIRGVTHIGVLKALSENSLHPSWISGASAGSMAAALYACGYSGEDIESIVLRHMNSNLFDVDYPGITGGILKWVFTKDTDWDGVVKGKKLEQLMKELTHGRTMREAQIPLAIPAVNINTGVTVMFVSNKRRLKDTEYIIYREDVPIYEAVRASIALPVVFRPKMVQGMRLVDGGVTENLPVQVLRRMGARKVIGVNLGYSGQRRGEVNNLLEIGSQSIDIMSYYITSLKTKKTDYIINPHIYDVGMTDAHRIPEMIQRGYDVTIESINTIKKVVNS
ncbi:patatin-like phospholipase family protein [Eubacteriales bacterium mix99]